MYKFKYFPVVKTCMGLAKPSFVAHQIGAQDVDEVLKDGILRPSYKDRFGLSLDGCFQEVSKVKTGPILLFELNKIKKFTKPFFYVPRPRDTVIERERCFLGWHRLAWEAEIGCKEELPIELSNKVIMNTDVKSKTFLEGKNIEAIDSLPKSKFREWVIESFSSPYREELDKKEYIKRLHNYHSIICEIWNLNYKGILDDAKDVITKREGKLFWFPYPLIGEDYLPFYDI